MGWSIECLDNPQGCDGAWASNVRELIEEHRNERGWFNCLCGGRGYIRKSYNLQEAGGTWDPILKSAIRFDEEPENGETYFPFVFLVGYSTADMEVDDIWFSYYKDTRPEGRLKMGHGPGGPPVVGKESVRDLVATLQGHGVLGP